MKIRPIYQITGEAEFNEVFGGVGFTWDYPAHLHFKCAKESKLLFEDPAHHREALADRFAI